MPNSKKVCIFIDGENLRHSIGSLFPEFDRRTYLPQTNWGDFFDWIAEEVAGPDFDRVRAYWYTVQNIDFFPSHVNVSYPENTQLITLLMKDEGLRKRIEGTPKGAQRDDLIKRIVEDLVNERDKMEKRFSGWINLQNEIAGRNNAVEFRRAGAIRYDLVKRCFGFEKAVDVKLATDLIRLKDIYDVAIIVSGDQDYVPAVEAIKDFGKHAINVSFLTNEGKLLPGGAKRLNHATDRSLELKHDDVKVKLNIK